MNSRSLPTLPISRLLPDILAALEHKHTALVHAPPGSGKTTRIPLALLDAPCLIDQKILMLEPRRLATRAAARHMAALLGENAGNRIGYRTRLDSRVSRKTRVEVVTEGILTRMLQHDPELSGYGCVIFDEFHERGMQTDLGLTLCLDVRDALRPDLRLVLMSATLDVEAAAALLPNCRILSCPSHTHSVTTRYLGAVRSPVEDRMAQAIRHAVATNSGDILAFLPGAREIHRTRELLGFLGPDISVHPLLGALTTTEQDQAIAPAASGNRKIVLATAIAETSLTIEGIRIVIDSGLARLPRFDPGSGMTRLITEPASLATITQRQGRAGRTAPGVCFRLWDQTDEISRKPYPPPEILDADLAPLALDLALWGVANPSNLTWLTPPPNGNFQSAQSLLRRLHLLDKDGRITSHGRDVALLPVHPRLGHMLLRAKEYGLGPTGARLAALLAEPGKAMRQGPDLRDALTSAAAFTSSVRDGMAQILRLASIPPGPLAPESTGLLTALAYPDRVARRQEDGSYRLTNGRKAVWPGPSSLAEQEFLAIADLDGEASVSRIWKAAPLSRPDLDLLFSADMTWQDELCFDPTAGRVTATRQRMLDKLCMERHPYTADPESVTRVLLESLGTLDALPWDKKKRKFQQRVCFLHRLDPQHWPDFSDKALRTILLDWLAPYAQGARSLTDLDKIPLGQALKNLLGWNRVEELDRLAPEWLTVPAGTTRAIDYSPESGPVLPVKLQEMFGCASTPLLADGKHALTLHLLSPAGRPLQITQDLPSFWQNGYPAVRAEMRGRYPRHPWPEDPTTALPTAKTKKAFSRGKTPPG